MTTIGNVCAFTNGKAHEQNVVEYGEYIIVNSKFISSDGVVKKYSNKQICPLFKNDIVMVMSDVPNGKAMSKCFCIDKDNKYTLNQRICALRTKQIPLYYMMQINRNDYFMKFDDGVKQTNLRKDDVLACPVYSTTIKEQTKIADFLSLIDQRIEKQRRLVESLKKYKRGVIFKLFSKNNPNNQSISLRELLQEKNDRNSLGLRVCSVAVNKGVVDQIEHLGRCFAASDTSKYRRVSYGDVVYTKSPTGDFPYGIVKQSKIHRDVCVSPLYGVYKTLNYEVGNLIHAYFELHQLANNYIRPLAQKGAKNTINITTSHFLDDIIYFPSNDKYRKNISNFLDKLTRCISIQEEKLQQNEKLKKGLLQQMFI